MKKIYHDLVEQSFHSAFSGDEDLKHHTLEWRFHPVGKTPPKTLCNSPRKAPKGYC